MKLSWIGPATLVYVVAFVPTATVTVCVRAAEGGSFTTTDETADAVVLTTHPHLIFTRW